jgi:hypothetical protein
MVSPDLHFEKGMRAGLLMALSALHRGVVPTCRQAGTGKKAGKSFILSLP